uniref:hypothetical protein n=1 Tax=Megasphaera sp. TaxID=2023260 RepID=UPI0025825929
ELFKQFQDNPSFKDWLTNTVFNLTYNKEGNTYELPEEAESKKQLKKVGIKYRPNEHKLGNASEAGYPYGTKKYRF